MKGLLVSDFEAQIQLLLGNDYKIVALGDFVELYKKGLNDSEKEIKELVRWIKENLGENVPLHFSAFYPCYKLTNLGATPVEKVIHAAEIAKRMGMKNVHTGNI